jgi:hypothetical protein
MLKIGKTYAFIPRGVSLVPDLKLVVRPKEYKETDVEYDPVLSDVLGEVLEIHGDWIKIKMEVKNMDKYREVLYEEHLEEEFVEWFLNTSAFELIIPLGEE